MANRFWIGGGPKKWDNASRWSATDGGGGGAGVPTSSDAVYFTSASSNDDCTIDVNADCASLTNTDYTGILDGDTFDLTCVGDFQFDSGALDLGTGTWTVGGNWDTSGVTVTQGTSTIILSGASKTLTTASWQDIYNITVTGTVTAGISTDLHGQLDVQGTLTINATWSAKNGTSSIVLSGTLDGAGTLELLDLASELPTGGTLNCDVQFYGDRTVPGRAFGGDVQVRSLSAANATATFGTGASQTITIAGYLYVTAAWEGNYTLDAATHDPDVDIGGLLDFTGVGAGTEIILAGDGNWNAAGDIDLTGGTLTAAASEFILDGAANQTVTSDTEGFYNLTITNTTASPGVTFADSCGATNMLKCITSDVTLTFTNGITGTFADVNLDGQDANYVTIRPSAGATYYWNVAAAVQTDVSYVSVSYCDATPGEDIDASNGTNNDGGNNDGWVFDVAAFQAYHSFGFPSAGRLKRGVAA